MNKGILLGLTAAEICQLLNDVKLPDYRALQIFNWLYRKQVADFGSMTNLPEKLRNYLEKNYVTGRATIERQQVSMDGTIKLLLRLTDNEFIETVGLPYADRFACCLSTQAGCPIGCIFCATGSSGFRRNLTAGEMITQLFEINNKIRQNTITFNQPSSGVNHIVFMGMGEPLLNYGNTIKAINLINHEIGIGARHITLSTVGYVPGIQRLAKENLQITLAISLHAASDEIRHYLIPSMKKWNLSQIIKTCKDYFEITGRKITFEFCLISGINDDLDQALKLARLIKGINCNVNLIAYNKVHGLKFRPPVAKRLHRFSQILQNEGINVTRRLARGTDIDAGCGQLRLKKTRPNLDG